MFKLKGAEIGGQRGKLCKGKFRVRLLAIKAKESTNKKAKTQGDDVSIVEFKVLEAIGPQEAIVHKHLNQSVNFQPVEPGMKRSWSMNMKNDASAGNLLAFLAAVAGIDPSDTKAFNGAHDAEKDAPVDWDEFYEFAAGPENPFGGEDGLELFVETDGKITEDGFMFVTHDWAPVEGAAQLFPPKDGEKSKAAA